jgi:spore germination protein GerM
MKDSKKNKKGVLLSSKFPKKLINPVINLALLAITAIILVLSMIIFSGCSDFSALGLNNSTSSADNTNTQDKTSEALNNETVADSAGTDITSEESNTDQATESTSEVTQGSDTQGGEITINVYYADENGEYLIGEARIISGTNKYIDAIAEMMKEPVDSSLVKLIPETTKINGVIFKDGVVKVDLSKNFVDDRFVSESMDVLLVYSIVDTLTEFQDVNSVEFFIDGVKLDVLGMLDIKEPLFRRSDLIKKD